MENLSGRELLGAYRSAITPAVRTRQPDGERVRTRLK